MTDIFSCFGSPKKLSIHPCVEGIRKKIVLVGDGYSGKTSLQVAFGNDNFYGERGMHDSFEEKYSATIFETYATTFSFLNDDGEVTTMELAMWDTAGWEAYKKLRPLSYSNTDIVMVCFSMDSPDSLGNVVDLWKPELDLFCPNVPILLIGMLCADHTNSIK